MIRIDERLAKEKFEAKMICKTNVARELQQERAQVGQKLVKESMEGVHKLAVPIVVEIGSERIMARPLATSEAFQPLSRIIYFF